jgi:putative CocE/NonD family hydrolase
MAITRRLGISLACAVTCLLAPHVAVSAQQASPDALAQYAGMYRNALNPDNVHAVYVEGGVLYSESAQRPRQRLTPDPAAGAPDRFRMQSPEAHVLFLRGAGGAVTSLRVVLDRGSQVLDEEQRFSDTPKRLNHFREYTREQVMIGMRDGVRLHTILLRPSQVEPGEDLPFLLNRTPYGVDDEDPTSINRAMSELAASGYIFVFQDVRGRYGSEGTFVMNRPLNAQHGPTDIDETTDTRDTIDWLLRNVTGNNGRVGVYGVSYDGFLATMAGINAHPAVKAISPQAPMTDVWLGDDFFHNGAFRETYGFDYVQQMEAQKTDARVETKQDTYDFFLDRVNFAGAASAAHMDKLPTARAFLTQPAYTQFWRDMAVEGHLAAVTVPTLEVGGYWDQEDMWGTQAQYEALKQHDSPHNVYMVLGPWNHGGWDGTGKTLGSSYGQLDFGQPTGTEFRKEIEFPFFERYLKDRPGFDLLDTASFRTGVNQWERYEGWPPASGVRKEHLFLGPAHRLSFAAPTAVTEAVAASYISDPADPVPYRHRPIQSTYGAGSKWYTWLVEDQRFVTTRKDVAAFTTEALDHDVTVTGDVMADLFAATTGTDGDFVVKLIDVYPGDTPAEPGYELMVADEIFRGRYRRSFEAPQAITPGEVDEYQFSLHAADHTFLKGHQIMVEVQSSWFPLYDRNPQTFVPNIMTAPKKAYRPATITIYSSPKYPSSVEVPIVSPAP